ncbi:hypothetical protein C2G38_2160273 [Gigaspora rosea]|uniref:Retrotransposon gag domain-containing protein n=1 Tax=Gigaspora rosea TaxID=44941 RepID=A0A397W020_9GLOM|nr:hypothetical protein C2G38_2160273 [Gigaspora rosea]
MDPQCIEDDNCSEHEVDLLREIANAFRNATIGVAAAAHPTSRETNLVRVDPFHGTKDENPFEWVEIFKCAVNANNWSPDRKIQIASEYLCGIAATWYDGIKKFLLHWNDDLEPDIRLFPILLHISPPPNAVINGRIVCLKELLNEICLLNQGQNQTQPQNPNSSIRNQTNEPTVQVLPQACNVNLCDLDNTGYYPERENALVTLMAWYQPYSTQRPRRNIKKSESKAEEKLRSNSSEVDPVIPLCRSTVALSEPMPQFSPSIEKAFYSQIKPYIEDIETNIAQLTLNAAMSLMLKKMMNKLALKIDELSTTIVVIEELAESKGTFNEFKYDDKALEEAKGFYTEEISDDDLFYNP